MTPVAPLVIGLIVQDAVLSTDTGSIPLPAGTRVELVQRASKLTALPNDAEFGHWHHTVTVGGKPGTVSSANLALPVDAGVAHDFGWKSGAPMTADLDGDGADEQVWLGVTEGAELYEGEADRKHAQSWLICDDGDRSTAVALHDHNGWGTSADLTKIERTDLTGDGHPELWMRFSTTVTEVGYGSDEVVVAGLFAGKIRTLLRIEEGTAARTGLSQYRWGRAGIADGTVVHDELELLTDCAPAHCVVRTKHTWRWREDHAAFVDQSWKPPVRATVKGGRVELADEPGGKATRTMTEDLDRITVLQITGDPHSERQLMVRVGYFGVPGWVPASAVHLDAPYLDLEPQ